MSSTATTLKGQPLDRPVLDALLRRRMFFTPSFEIYGGVGGLFDYGPPGCALQANIIDVWRKHFILEEDMLEVDCTVLTPHDVLKTSGHVDKFADWMCKDPKNGDILRADHFVEDVLEARLKGDKEARGQKVEEVDDPTKKKKRKQKTEAIKLEDAVVQEYEEVLAKIDNYNGEELGELIKKFDLRNPLTGVQPSPPVSFNLMFQTAIGPSSNLPGYLRPETAQGQFLNFAKLLEFNQQQMPFASASIGKSYRNEISPRAGLLRVREFLMAEIEHFVDPEGGKKHPKFSEVENVELALLARDVQLAGKTDIKHATIGEAVRTGMVDNETLGYFIARIALFLKKIGVDMSKATSQEQREALAKELSEKGSLELEVAGVADGKVEISKDLVTIEFRKKVENTREYTPNVIEPSFGIGRILYSLIEHSYWTRGSDGGDEARSVLSFPPTVAPTKVLIVPLSANKAFKPFIQKISQKLRKVGVSSRIDDSSATIGKRYSRNDELGTPLGITIDFQSVQDSTYTLRDRDSTKQVRADEDAIVAAVLSIVEGSKEWKDIEAELPAFEGQEVDVAVR
ncbi:glycyl-tRNA synthetase [Verticillium dahliae VdLs.17]|uniref:glycine--tRNA ligase n=1 Tax=Verticillium dahliae (strain VdLs.17 / ATCC MYA-4575 / FGSC 10137) TaxID=498257 RepID=G2X6S3_VERDV|nr:glycyl-tRNA synthetase [Verticillium dahliae VdLs.17]EGY14691.1 glycyl-tRNA synthetase [Verticillium dahliae VdLs.17]